MALLTPIKAIRAYCLGCSGGSYLEVRECVIPKCPLYPYRMGKRPKGEEDTIDLDAEEKSSASYIVFEEEVHS